MPRAPSPACSGRTRTRSSKPIGQFNVTHLRVFKNKVEIWLNYKKVNELQIDGQKFRTPWRRTHSSRNRVYFGKDHQRLRGLQRLGWVLPPATIHLRAIAEMPPPPKAPSGYIAPVAPKKTK